MQRLYNQNIQLQYPRKIIAVKIVGSPLTKFYNTKGDMKWLIFLTY